jgi:hypothetical protein
MNWHMGRFDAIRRAVLVTGLIVSASAGDSTGAEKRQSAKAAKQAEKPAKRSGKAEPGNASVRTQSRTADAFAAERGAGKDAAAAEASDPEKQLADVERKLREEASRHESAVAKLNRDEQKAAKAKDGKRLEAARAALKREEESNQRTRSALEERRTELLRRLGRLDDPAKPASTPPAAPSAR